MNETQAAGAVMYRAFISYNHQDQRWAVWLQHALQEAKSQMEVLRETGYRGRLWRWLAAEMAGGGERYSVCNTPP